MDLEMILFTFIEVVVIFIAVYFFFTNIKIQGETKNSYLSILGKLFFNCFLVIK